MYTWPHHGIGSQAPPSALIADKRSSDESRRGQPTTTFPVSDRDPEATMFVLPGRGNALSQRGGGAPFSDHDDENNAAAPEAGMAATPAAQQARRQDTMRLFIIMMLLLFIFNGNDNHSPSKSSSADAWARNHVVLDPAEVKSLKSVVAIEESQPFAAINITGLFRGSWKSSLMVPTYQFDPLINASQMLTNGTDPHTGGGIVLQLEQIAVEGLPEVALLFGMIRAFSPPKGSESPRIEFSMPVQGLVLMNPQHLYLFSTPLRTQRLRFMVSPLTSNFSEAETAIKDGYGARVLPQNSNSIASQIGESNQLYVYVHNSVNDSLVSQNSSAFDPLESKLSPRFKFLQLRASSRPFCHYSFSMGLGAKKNSHEKGDSGIAFDGLAAATRPCDRHLAISFREYDLHYNELRGKADWYSMVMVFACLIQIGLTVLQMRHSSQPAMAARTSVLAILGQSLLDAVECMFHMMLSAALPAVFFASFMWVSLLKLLLFSVFQMRLVMNAYKARYAQEIAAEGWRGLRTRMINLHLRFYAVVLFVLMVAATFPTRPVVTIIMLYSFWWPQVVHSAYTGRRHPFHSLYLYGTSVLRVLLPLYLLVCPNNMFVMLVEYFSPQYDLSESAARKEVLDLPTAWFLCAYVVLQVIVLELQTRWGPRFFIPSSWVPQRYNYHRPVPPALLGSHHDAAEVTAADANSQSGIAMTLFSSSSGASGDYHRLPTSEDSVPAANAPMDVGDEESGALHSPMECVICYNSIYLNTRQQYMITPCDHLFHEECLLQWMRVKLECPVCRASLPALDEDENP